MENSTVLDPTAGGEPEIESSATRPSLYSTDIDKMTSRISGRISRLKKICLPPQ